MGADRYLEPSVVVVIQVLWENLIEDLGIRSAAEITIMDMALMTYYNTLSAQRRLGNVAIQIERELFLEDSLISTSLRP